MTGKKKKNKNRKRKTKPSVVVVVMVAVVGDVASMPKRDGYEGWI